MIIVIPFLTADYLSAVLKNATKPLEAEPQKGPRSVCEAWGEATRERYG